MSNNFSGYLLKFGSTLFPERLLAQDPQFTPSQRTDAQAYRDANNDLHRVVIDNHKTKFSITTLDGITLAEKLEIDTAMAGGLLIELERKYHITVWNDDTNDYITGDFYLADVTYTHKHHDNSSITYGAITYTFVQY